MFSISELIDDQYKEQVLVEKKRLLNSHLTLMTTAGTHGFHV